MKKVAVIVLNYKMKDTTLKCIESIKKSDYSKLEIILVDNNSDDGIENDIKKYQISFIQTGANLGYSGGNNVGIKKALKGDCSYVLVLNPDTTIQKNTISNFVNELEKNQADILGPKIYFSNSKKIWYAGGIFDLANVLGSHRGVDTDDTGHFEEVIETDFVTGAAIFIKREVLEKIGLFDEDFFLYYEDSDFCYRAKIAGFKVMYTPKAIVYHDNAKSTGLGSPLQDYYITRNRMLFASKYLSFRTRFALFREAIKNIKIPARKMALLDFIRGDFGKGNI
jgi:GT2 family glycosyltransferase